jgi:hypothetical protein
MCGKLWRLGVIVLAAGVFAGCKTNNTVQNTKPPDPLCRCKIPVEGKPRDADAEVTTHLDPPPPPLPGREGGIVVRQPAPLGAPRPLQVGFDQPE